VSGLVGGFELTIRCKGLFFDVPYVVERIGAKNAELLSRAGAWVQRRARSSMRRGKKGPSAVGTPPHAHSKDAVATLKNILFAYDPHNDSVVVGPVRLNQFNQNAATLGNITVPQIHEFGGSVNIRESSSNKGRTWRRRDMRRNPRTWEIYRTRRAVYPERKFMEPALIAEAPNFPDLWTGSVTGSGSMRRAA